MTDAENNGHNIRRSAEITPLYLYEDPDWPELRWNSEALITPLARVRHQQGRLYGQMRVLGFDARRHVVLRTLTEDVVKTSAIEGEKLDAEQVRSSIARRLGVDIGGLRHADRNVEGIVDVMMDATGNFAAPLSEDRLFGWHAALFPAGRSGLLRIAAGNWRTDSHGPMQVVSGPIGRERVHFEAPSATRVPAEMAAFLQWFNGPSVIDPVIKAALAHLRFVTIHPFDDGNGRIARAIADLQLARSEDDPQRFYSMSAQIRNERDAYYDILKRTQRETLDVTPWLEWFLACLSRAIKLAEDTAEAALRRAQYWERYGAIDLNGRQRRVLALMLETFEGKLTTTKYAKLAKCSQDTAYRDILTLVAHGVLAQNPEGGRSTSYSLAGWP